MVRIEPFVGLRPDADALARSVDGAVTSGQRIARRRRHPNHVAWLEAGDDAPPVGVEDWLRAGHLLADDRPRLRWVEQHLPDGHVVGGVLGRVPLDDLVAHEGVDRAAVRRRVLRDRLQRVDPRPLLAVATGTPEADADLLDELASQPSDVDVVDSRGVRHRCARLDDDLASRCIAHVGARAALLADGHHRVAAARTNGRVALPTLVTLAGSAPRLLPVWRVVVSRAEDAVLRAHLASDGDPHGVVEAHWRHQRTRWSAGRSLPVIAAWERAQAVPGLVRSTTTSDPAAAAVAQRDGAVLVTAPAPSVEQVLAHVQRHGPLPPKSTAFHPKPRVGLVVSRVPESARRR